MNIMVPREMSQVAEKIWLPLARRQPNTTSSQRRPKINRYLLYIPRNMHTVFALLCFVVVIHWLIDLRNKLPWNFNRNAKHFINENAFQNVVFEMAAISSRRKWVKTFDCLWNNSLFQVTMYELCRVLALSQRFHQRELFSLLIAAMNKDISDYRRRIVLKVIIALLNYVMYKQWLG